MGDNIIEFSKVCKVKFDLDYSFCEISVLVSYIMCTEKLGQLVFFLDLP